MRTQSVVLTCHDTGHPGTEHPEFRTVQTYPSFAVPALGPGIEQAQVDGIGMRREHGDLDAVVDQMHAETLRGGGGHPDIVLPGPSLPGTRTEQGGNVLRVKIVVCVKHVPDIQGERELGPDLRMIRDNGDGTINELDENALEAAAQIAEGADDPVEIVVLTVGPDDAEDAARRGLQLGADAAVHVLDDDIAGSDVIATAQVLAAAIRRIGAVDLVLTGMAGLDGLTSLVPTALADMLELPALTLAAEVTVADGEVTVRRDLDHATEVLAAPLPALVSVTDRINEPRYPNFQAIMAARKKPVEMIGLADLGIDPETVGADGSRTRVLSAAPRPPRADRVLVTGGAQAGRDLASWLIEQGLVRDTPKDI